MKTIAPSKLFAFGTVVLSAMMLVSLLVPVQTAEAAAFQGNPCPSYSIQDVFADPNGNWDNDLMRNSDELYNGLNPCIVDTQAFCGGGGNPLCLYPTYTYNYTYYPSACQSSINASPNADYDGDGVSNSVEVLNGANPCAHPCPNPTGTDLALNPNGSWDNDGISNAIEVSQGTNPCNGYNSNPCPYYSGNQINYLPGYDWDGDGVSNSDEISHGTNPCVFNVVVPAARVTTYVPARVTTYVPTQRLPHVTIAPSRVYQVPARVYVAPTTSRVALCPHGYPYYHAGNGLCYANPVGPTFR